MEVETEIRNEADVPIEEIQELISKIKKERPNAYRIFIWTRYKEGKVAITYSSNTRGKSK